MVLFASGHAPAQRLFDGGEVFDVDPPAQKILIDDFNKDAKLDTALLQEAHGRVSVYLNRGAPLFEAPLVYDAGLSPIAAASGDLDADGFPELVVVCSGSASISVLLNREDGTFASAVQFPVGRSPRALGLADFNGDGFLDAAVSDLISTTFGSLFILFGDGKGKFHDAVPFEVGDNAHALVALDLDGDGRADVAVAHTQTVTVLRSTDNGTFLPRVDTDLGIIAANPRFLASGDPDRDGRPDLGVLADSGLLLLLSNAGGGDFKPQLVGQAAGSFFSSRFLLVADFTGDGLLDFITLGQPGKDATMRVHAGLGDGTFAAPEDLSVGSDLYDLALADLDGDATPDLLALSGGSPGMTLFRGTGGGKVSLHLTVPLAGAPRDIAALDVDRDGTIDLLAASSKVLFILKGSGAGRFEDPVPEELRSAAIQRIVSGDFDGDAREDLAWSDLVAGKVVVSFFEGGHVTKTLEHPVHKFPSRLAAADFDRDGFLDVAVADQVDPFLTVVFRAGAGDGSLPPLDVPAGSYTTAIDAADSDGDGSIDLLSSARDAVRVVFGDGRGSFPRSTTLDDLKGASTVRGADLDGDGEMDLVSTPGKSLVVLFSPARGGTRRQAIDLGSDVIAIAVGSSPGSLPEITATGSIGLFALSGRPGGVLGPLERYPSGSLPRALLLADLDGDGLLDCATANFGSASISVFHGASRKESVVFRRGDANADGTLQLTDAVAVLGRLFLGREPLPCPDAGDADDDGALSVTDAVRILLYLFRGGAPPPAPGPDACGSDPTPDTLGNCSGGCP